MTLDHDDERIGLNVRIAHNVRYVINGEPVIGTNILIVIFVVNGCICGLPEVWMIVVVANEKGGSSKSTLASALAVEAVLRGFKTLVVDADPQGTLSEWSAVGAEEGNTLPTVVAMGDQLRAQLPSLAETYDLTFVDLPGRIARRVAGALMVADLVLLPCGPSNADLWALETTLEMIGEAREMRPELKSAAVIARKRPGTTSGREIRGALEGLGTQVLPTTMGLREVYADALGAGSGPSAFASSSLAALEVRNLFDHVENLLGIGGEHGQVPAA